MGSTAQTHRGVFGPEKDRKPHQKVLLATKSNERQVAFADNTINSVIDGDQDGIDCQIRIYKQKLAS